MRHQKTAIMPTCKIHADPAYVIHSLYAAVEACKELNQPYHEVFTGWLQAFPWDKISVADPLFSMLLFRFVDLNIAHGSISERGKSSVLYYGLQKIPKCHGAMHAYLKRELAFSVVQAQEDESDMEEMARCAGLDGDGPLSYETCKQAMPGLSFREWLAVMCSQVQKDILTVMGLPDYGETGRIALSEEEVIDLSVTSKGDILVATQKTFRGLSRDSICLSYATPAEADAIVVHHDKTDTVYIILARDLPAPQSRFTVAGPFNVPSLSYCWEIASTECCMHEGRSKFLRTLSKIDLDKYTMQPRAVLFMKRMCKYYRITPPPSFVGDVLDCVGHIF